MVRPAARPGLLALAAAALLAGAPASAQDEPAADPEALFEQGRSLRAEHRDAEALAVFERLRAATGSARALAQVGLAEGALGRWVDAEVHLTEALRGPGDAWVATHRGPLADALATVQQHLGGLAVECDVAGAEVVVAEGAPVALPLANPLRLVAGSVAVVVRAPGRSAAQRVVNVPGGGLAREVFVLATLPPAAPAVVARPPTLVAPRSGSRRAWAIGTGAAAVTVAAAGTVVYLLGFGEVSTYNGERRCPGLDAPTQPPECTQYIDAAETMRAVAIGLWAGGAVLAGVSIGLLATEPRERPRAFTCAPGLASVGCTLRF